MERNRIHTECHADTLLTVRLLGMKQVTHQATNGLVLKKLDKISGCVVGIIDNDKRKPGGFDTFTKIEEKHHLVLLQKPESQTFLITVNPAIEGFLFYCAEHADIDPGYYGFKTLNRLKQVCKNVHANKNQQLLAFINTLKQKNPAPIQLYTSWIRGVFEK